MFSRMSTKSSPPAGEPLEDALPEQALAALLAPKNDIMVAVD